MATSEYDGFIKQGVKNRKTPGEILDYEGMKEPWDALKKRVKEYVEKRKAAENTATCTMESDDDTNKEPADGTEQEGGKKKGKSPDGKKSKLRKLLEAELPAAKVPVYEEMVQNARRATVKAFPEPKNGSLVRDIIKDTPVNQLFGTPGLSYVACFYETPCAFEAQTGPKRRTAPYNDTHCCKMVHGILEARSGSDSKRSIMAGDMYFINDGGNSGTSLIIF